MEIKYKCECGYKGPAAWINKIEPADGGHWESEYRGCPECERKVKEMQAFKIIKGDDK